MSKKALLRLAMSICFAFCVVLLGHTTVFADEVKPVHEYNFDKDPLYKVIDSGKNAIDGQANRVDPSPYRTGYNGIGKSYYFDGFDVLSFPDEIMPVGAISIRFKFKKDASTISNTQETILLTDPNSQNQVSKLYISIIGKEKNQESANLNPLPGSLRIYKRDNAVNFELQTPDSICDGQWHDILYTWDGTTNVKSVKLYVDNMKTPVSQATANSIDMSNKRRFSVGSGEFGNGIGKRLIGEFDNFQIYDSAIMPDSNISSNLKAIAGNSKIDLNWNPVTDATSYTVKRSTTTGGPYTTIASGITGTTYTDTDVTNGTTYYYVVTAIINGSEGWNSNEASATPQASTDQPTGNKALLVITMVTGERKEYEMTADKINDFIAWYNSKAASSPTYVIEKDYNKASFTARKDYIAYDQISNFEVNEYNN